MQHLFNPPQESDFRFYQRIIEAYGGSVPRADYVAPPKRHKNTNPQPITSRLTPRPVDEVREYIRSPRGYLMRRDKLAA